jgi:cytoskeletal protein CcmA (bactofilin family)
MWNRRKEEEPAPRTTPAPPTSSVPAKEGIPMSSLPSRPTEPRSDVVRGGAAIIGKSVVLKGQIYGREDLTIDGEVEGTVELQEHRLTIGPNGKVVATIKAREIVVLGTVQGNIETRDKIDIRKEAKVVGDIRTARIVIEEGAYFKGSIDIVRAEAPKPAAQPVAAPKPQPVASGAPSSPAAAAGAGAGDIKR